MALFEVLFYLGKPQVIDVARLPRTIKARFVQNELQVIAQLKGEPPRPLAVVMDLDTIFEINSSKNRESSTSQGRYALKAIRAVAPPGVSFIGVTAVESFVSTLSSSGCDEACLSSELPRVLSTLALRQRSQITGHSGRGRRRSTGFSQRG